MEKSESLRSRTKEGRLGMAIVGAFSSDPRLVIQDILYRLIIFCAVYLFHDTKGNSNFLMLFRTVVQESNLSALEVTVLRLILSQGGFKIIFILLNCIVL